MNASDHASEFLHHIFPPPKQDLGEAFIEVRVLGDAKKGQFYGQRWYQSIDELLDDLDSLHELAREKKACVAFSPALRMKRVGTKDAVLGASCLWNDQPTFTCSKQECIQRLQDSDFFFEIVDSGNSAHGYILLKEFCDDIQKIEYANRLVRQRYEGDNVHDAGRVMRIPGAWNYKNPAAPKLCTVIQCAEKRYDTRVDQCKCPPPYRILRRILHDLMLAFQERRHKSSQLYSSVRVGQRHPELHAPSGPSKLKRYRIDRLSLLLRNEMNIPLRSPPVQVPHELDTKKGSGHALCIDHVQLENE